MSIHSYLNQTVKRKPKSGKDRYGKVETAESELIKCRIKGSTRQMIGVNGKEYTVDAELWTKPTQPLFIDDIIEWETKVYKVTHIKEQVGLGGKIDHKKAFLLVTKET